MPYHRCEQEERICGSHTQSLFLPRCKATLAVLPGALSPWDGAEDHHGGWGGFVFSPHDFISLRLHFITLYLLFTSSLSAH